MISASTPINIPTTVFTSEVPSTSISMPSRTPAETVDPSSSHLSAIEKGGLAAGVIIGVLLLTILIDRMYRIRKCLFPCLNPKDSPTDETSEVILDKKTGRNNIPLKYIGSNEARGSHPCELASHDGIQSNQLSSQSGYSALVELDSIQPMRTLELDCTNRSKGSTANTQTWSIFLSNNNQIISVPGYDEVRNKPDSDTNCLPESQVPLDKEAIHEESEAVRQTNAS